MEMVLWFGWAILCAWTARVLIVALLPRKLGLLSYLAAYAGSVLLLVVGATLSDWSGIRLYGFERSNPWHAFGWWIVAWSPLGFPLLAGAPIVVVTDLVVLLWRGRGQGPSR